jgi:hypothetical protein
MFESVSRPNWHATFGNVEPNIHPDGGTNVTIYTLVIKNNTTLEGDVSVYQTDPNIKVVSAWLTDQVSPTGTVSFTWNPDTSNQATPELVYWVTFGAKAEPKTLVISQALCWVTFSTYEQGQLLGQAQITNAATIAYPPNVYSMTVTINSDQTWTVGPTA